MSCGKCRPCEEGELYSEPSPLHTIAEVDTESKCKEAIERFMRDCSESEHHVVGFDAEWNHKFGMRTFGSKIGKVLIVSICSPRGFCALFRLNKLVEIPICLKDFLYNASIAKVGVEIEMVVHHLWTDYKVRVQRYADLRALAISYKSLNRSVPDSVAKQIYNIYKHRDISEFDHTKWLDERLSKESISFGAKNVFAMVEIHKKIVPKWLAYFDYEPHTKKKEISAKAVCCMLFLFLVLFLFFFLFLMPQRYNNQVIRIEN